MKKLIVSGLTTLLIGSVAIGATMANFTSRATVHGNVFSTAQGELEIRINGNHSIPGFTVNNAVPGTCQTGQFTVNNFGHPFFDGSSSMDAHTLVISAMKNSGDTSLYNALTVTVEANRGWPTRMPVYNGSLSGLTNADLLAPRWSSLNVGDSEDVFYQVCLPHDATGLNGQTVNFDFIVDASA